MTAEAEIEIRAPLAPEHAELVSADALAFVAELVGLFRSRLRELLVARAADQKDYAAGSWPAEPAETSAIRDGQWRVNTLPLAPGRVELTGPARRKTLINGLNAPVDGFMVDLDNAQSPTWQGLLDAQANLREAAQGSLRFIQAEDQREYHLNPRTCPLMLRPRSWHLWEKHLYIDGQPVPAALFDLGLYLFHCAPVLCRRGQGVHLYLPKLEHYREAALWREMLEFAGPRLELPEDAIRVSLMIDTLPAALQMDELLHELRDYAVALSFGRWDYAASAARCLAAMPGWRLPERQALDLSQGFMAACARRLVAVARRRGVLALGGGWPWLPIRNDDEAHAKARDALRDDLESEARLGFDGGWIVHPAFAEDAREIFNANKAPEEPSEPAHEIGIGPQALYCPPQGEISEAGLRNAIATGVQYLQAWLSGQGCVPLYNLMEDAATVEVCRIQLWQWLHDETVALLDGRSVNRELFEEALAEELDNIEAEVGAQAFEEGRFQRAAQLLSQLCLAEELSDFFSPSAYELLD